MSRSVDPNTRYCKTCKLRKPLEEFTPYHQRISPHEGSRCIKCVADCNASWYFRNKEYAKSYMRDYRKKVKDDVFNHYGRVCVCCGEDQMLFLDIDHMNNDGAEHRKKHKLTAGTQFYVWLRDNGFPANFQDLCCNCNRGKFRNNGVCPHKENTQCQILIPKQ